MQIPFLYFNNGSGWTSLNPHDNNIAALADFSIQWGTDSPPDQPDPSVMTFHLRDTTGTLAGAAMDLSGARVLLQLSPEPTWGTLRPDMGTWADQNIPLGKFHQSYTPLPNAQTSQNATTLFDGIISNGGTVEPHGDEWIIKLSATSRMLIWKRLKKHGPTSSDPKFAGLHWVGITDTRIKEMNKRAAAASAPQVVNPEDVPLWYPAPIAPYSDDDDPDQLAILHRTFGQTSHMSLWYEVPNLDHSELRPVNLATPVTIGIDEAGTAYVTAADGKRPAFDGSTIEGSLELDIPDPITQISVKTRKVTQSDGAFKFDEADITFTDNGLLPANLKTTQSSVTIDADIITADDTSGAWTGGTWTPSTHDREIAAAWLQTVNMRLKPGDVVLSSDHLDPATYPWLFWTAPSGPILFMHTAMSNLTGSDSRPAFSGAFTTVGGTLTFRWVNKKPRLSHEVTLAPLPTANTTALKWSAFEGWPVAWKDVNITLAEMSVISTIDKK